MRFGHLLVGPNDETLPIKYKPKHLKRAKTRNKMEGPTSKKTKESPKRANHKGTSSS
jgi:hypothetical protein